MAAPGVQSIEGLPPAADSDWIINLGPGKRAGLTKQKAQHDGWALLKLGAGCRTRTRHLMITNQLLYLMS